MPPDLSVIVPVFNRGSLVRHTLDSVRAASSGLAVEVVVVDDGSTVPLAHDLARSGRQVDRLIRQPNRGLLFARLAGLDAAGGRHVLFLDSDDFVSAPSLRSHVETLDAGADVSYSDQAHQTLDADGGPVGEPEPDAPLPVARSAAEFFIAVQPAPHSPAFRTDYLRRRVAAAPFAPSPLYNAVAEIWFYHICAPFPARVAKSPGLAIIGRHPGPRLTNHWEKLGVASLAVMEAFVRTCPSTADAACARQLVAEKAFASWRRLPRGFPAEFETRLLGVWRRLRDPARRRHGGGRYFSLAAQLLGPEVAARLFRRLQNGRYDLCRTMPDSEVHRLLAALPPPEGHR